MFAETIPDLKQDKFNSRSQQYVLIRLTVTSNDFCVLFNIDKSVVATLQSLEQSGHGIQLNTKKAL